jgi:hypothetical protein
MLTNPLKTLRYTPKNELTKFHEPFAGPYRPSEAAWLFSLVEDARKQKHGVYFSRSGQDSRMTATVYLKRSEFALGEEQNLSELFETIDKQTSEKLGLEILLTPPAETFTQCVRWIADIAHLGHIPHFIETTGELGLKPCFKRRHLDEKPKTRKSNNTQTDRSVHASERILHKNETPGQAKTFDKISPKRKVKKQPAK